MNQVPRWKNLWGIIKMRDLIIVGASGFGREALQWAKEINILEKKWNILGFLDDNINALNGYDCDYKVVGTIKDYIPNDNEDYVIALATPSLKEIVVHDLETRGAKFVSLIHPDAHIGDFNKLGKGVVIYPGARVTVNVEIGDYAVILDLTTLGHDVSVGDFSTICGGCGINGHVRIGRSVFIGSHVTTAPGVKIGDNSFVGTGSVVITNIKEDYRVFGNPAKKVIL